MSVQTYSKSKLKWFQYGYGCIVNIIRGKLKMTGDDSTVLKLLWRLGLNEYRSGVCDASITTLEKLLHMVDNQEDLTGNKVRRKTTVYEVTLKSKIHQTIGRAATCKFLEDKNHEYLQLAYRHYQHAVDCMIVELSTMMELPNLLIEFGIVLEYYGAFEAAMTVYSRILTQFPTCRAYFAALYRSAIVGRHLGSVSNDVNYQQEVIEKSIDIHQFLLEALPVTIQDLHAVFLYARAFEVSLNLQIRYRAQGAYSSFYDLCKKKNVFGAQSVDEKSWLENPLTWFQLGNTLEKSGEFLIAKDAFNKFIEEAKRRSTFERDLSDILDIPSCLTLALHFASYQNFTEAVKFAEVGLKIDRYDRRIRNLISRWSSKYQEDLKKDEVALLKIIQVWKSRCWSWGFIKRLKHQRIEELKAKLANNYFDVDTRKHLSYYARRTYRPQFHFEEVCATRIQRSFRKYRKTWIWQEAQRCNYGLQATELYHRYTKEPFQRALRKEVTLAVNHKYMPRKHPLHNAVRKILHENQCLSQIVRCIKAYQKRYALQIKIEQRRSREFFVYCQYAIRIQKYARSLLAKKRVKQLKLERFRLLIAAKKIQRLWFVYSSSTDYIARRQFRLQLRNRGKAMFVFRKRLLPLIRRYRVRKKSKIENKANKHHRISSKVDKRFTKLELQNAACRIQRFYRHFISNIWQRVARIAAFQRKYNKLSFGLQSQLSVEFSSDLVSISSALYQNPGINPRAPQYQLILLKPFVVVHRLVSNNNSLLKETPRFSLVDLEVFSLLLKNPFCCIKKLIFLDCVLCDGKNTTTAISNFCKALRKCKSIESIMIIGGNWSVSNLQQVFELVQIENPRIRTLAIEKIGMASRIYDEIGLFGSRLLMDYFNYTIPGISTVSLHGCSLRDEQFELLAKGVEVNTSIKYLGLSLNWMTDIGFQHIIEAIKNNSSSSVETIDCSNNFISMGNCVKHSLLKYRSKAHQTYLMEIILFGNRIHTPLYPVEFALSQRISPPLSIRYSEDDKPATSAKWQHCTSPNKSTAHTCNKEWCEGDSLGPKKKKLLKVPLKKDFKKAGLIGTKSCIK